MGASVGEGTEACVGAGTGGSVGFSTGASVGSGTGASVGCGTGASVGSGTGASVGAGTGASAGCGSGASVGADTGASVGFRTGGLVGLSSTLLSQNSGMPNGYWFPFSSQQLRRPNSKGHSTGSYWTVGLSQLRLKKLLQPASNTGLLKALQSQFWVGS